MSKDETITFRASRGLFVHATESDRIALQNYGMRWEYPTQYFARKACENVGVTFALEGQAQEPENFSGEGPAEAQPFDNAKPKARKKKPVGKVKHTTREAWLVAAVDCMRPLFQEAGTPLKDKVRVSCGWPLGSRKAIGQAFYSECSGDGTREVFISPKLGAVETRAGVLATLLHELVHCALPKGTMHKRPFATLAAAVGLVKPWTATTASGDLMPQLAKIASTLGAYPHAAMSNVDRDRKKQTTRLLKCECPKCGYIVRTTAKWLEVGAPRCTVQAHGEMKVKD